MELSDLERAVAALAIDHNALSPEDAVRVIYSGREQNRDLTEALLQATGELPVLAAIAAELGMPMVDLYATAPAYTPDADLVARCDLGMLRDHNALPLRGPNGQTAVAMANPRTDQDMVAYLNGVFGERPVLVLASAGQIQQRLVGFTSSNFDGLDLDPADTVAASGSLPTSVAANPIVEWVDQLLARAAAEGASDVQMMFQANGSLLVRFREDGMWRPQQNPLRRRENEIVGTLLSKCDTIDVSDKKRPQDGTFTFAGPGGRAIDARLAMLPQAYGPTVVTRVLDPNNINRKLEAMGFSETILAQMRRVVASPQGSVFFIGPTGSGKTTTLYGLLKEFNALEKNILTAEDPIEYRLPNIGQTQIRGDLGEKSLTFAMALRAMLRLAPDVILVGEVRDSETAEVSMHAALTGHMVLSTLHAKSAIGAYQRLEELGVEPYLASESLSMAVNQRLIRQVHDCGTYDAPTRGEAAFLAKHNLEIPDRVQHVNRTGCLGCKGTGYKGRMAVVEVLEPSEELRTMVAERRSMADIYATARASDGYTSILTDAFRHVMEGRTTVNELLRCLDTGGMS